VVADSKALTELFGAIWKREMPRITNRFFKSLIILSLAVALPRSMWGSQRTTISLNGTWVLFAKILSASSFNNLGGCLSQASCDTTQRCYTLLGSCWPRLFAFSARVGTFGLKIWLFGNNWRFSSASTLDRD
jgi:hypothetical protein